MNENVYFSNPIANSLIKILLGVLLAIIFYQLALKFVSTDCFILQSNIKKQGISYLFYLMSIGIGLFLIGFPTSILCIVAGVLFGPFLGAPLVSQALIIACLIQWLLGRGLMGTLILNESKNSALESKIFYKKMMNGQAASGYAWAASHSLNAPIPYSFFSFLAGRNIRHLSIWALMSGIFVGSVLPIASYTLAGASIGCATINQILGLDTNSYHLLIIISCAILLMLRRLQSRILGDEVK